MDIYIHIKLIQQNSSGGKKRRRKRKKKASPVKGHWKNQIHNYSQCCDRRPSSQETAHFLPSTVSVANSKLKRSFPVFSKDWHFRSSSVKKSFNTQSNWPLFCLCVCACVCVCVCVCVHACDACVHAHICCTPWLRLESWSWDVLSTENPCSAALSEHHFCHRIWIWLFCVFSWKNEKGKSTQEPWRIVLLTLTRKDGHLTTVCCKQGQID